MGEVSRYEPSSSLGKAKINTLIECTATLGIGGNRKPNTSSRWGDLKPECALNKGLKEPVKALFQSRGV